MKLPLPRDLACWFLWTVAVGLVLTVVSEGAKPGLVGAQGTDGGAALSSAAYARSLKAAVRSGDLLDLSQAVIVVPAPDGGSEDGLEAKAAAIVRDEIARRTRLRLRTSSKVAPEGAQIFLGTRKTLRHVVGDVPVALQAPERPESYALWVDADAGRPPRVYGLGLDGRGALYAAGRLLRALRMGDGVVALEPTFRIATAPKFSLRGHQLGHRPKTNSYDAWTVPMWEQYLRDLIVYGANTVELIPPGTDDAAFSPHFPLPYLDMLAEMSRLADAYGLAVWLWYPIIDADSLDEKAVTEALTERRRVFGALKRVDAVFVPGGDPGEVHPRQLFPLMERQKAVLREYHPAAQIWVSPQGFDWDGKGEGWLETFYEILEKSSPAWLDGVVFGPQVSDPLPVLRQRVPSRYPIRRYPDITHCLDAQYSVPAWDSAFHLTLYREPINPRPHDYAAIFRSGASHSDGFITYSEGVNDDVNKVVWSVLGWDPETSVEDILVDYGNYFIGRRYGRAFAAGLQGLEKNWRGPLIANVGVSETLRIFQEMEREATPQEKLNWRFQLALYRAYYDAYTRRRLIYETELEEKAMDVLRAAERVGAEQALNRAEAILDRAHAEPVAGDLRARTFELAEALFQSIRMQLSVKRYQAASTRRGANLDLIDVPLNDSVRLRRAFRSIRALSKEKKRVSAIEALTRGRYRAKLERDREVIQQGIQ